MDVPKVDVKTLIETAKNIILKPEVAWPRIKAVSISNKQLILTYALPFAAIAAVLTLCTIWLGTFLPFGVALEGAVGQLILPLAVIIISSIIVNELAETFQSTKNLNQTFKLITYSYTPMLLANIVASISWALGWVQIFGLYGIYLIWLGLPLLMNTTEDKKPVYTLVIVVVIFVIQLILSAIIGIDRI